MARLQPDAQFVYICGKGNDDGRPYVAQIDADGNLITTGSDVTVDAADVTYTPAVAADWDGGVDPGNQNQANDQLAERVKDLEGLTGDTYLPTRFINFHPDDSVVTGNAIAVAALTTGLYNMRANQNAGANGDVFTNSALLMAGAYTLKLLYEKHSNQGILDIDFKHVNDAAYTSIHTGLDFYAAGSTPNQIFTHAFTVVTSGRQIFRFTVNGKNGSSSAYNIYLVATSAYLAAGDS